VILFSFDDRPQCVRTLKVTSEWACANSGLFEQMLASVKYPPFGGETEACRFRYRAISQNVEILVPTKPGFAA
jgi:hypothetical protein